MSSSTIAAQAATRRLQPLDIACIAATWFVWGSTYLAIRFALRGFAPFFLMGTRFVLAGAALLIWQLARGAAVPGARAWRNAAIVGALMLGCGMGGTAFAEQTIGSGLVVAFIAVTPLLLVLIGLLFGERPTRRELLAVSVGLTGVLMLTQGMGFQSSLRGLLAISIGCCGWTIGSVMSRRGFALAPGATGFATEMLCGGLALLCASGLSGESWRLSDLPGPWAAWLYLVVFGSLIAFNAYMVLLERVSLSVASSYTLVNPVVALLLGVTLGGERVTAWEWAAAAVVFAGVVLLFLRGGSAPAGRGAPAAD